MDSHVRYFDWVGGIFKEVVYDNMKNVVTKFLGKNEKMLNEDLIKMSIYYGFEINVTNCYSGNEKGYVENSVKVVRKEAFAHRYRFESLKDAEEYLHQRLEILNGDSRLEEERRLLKAAKPPLELGKISKQRVDKYSFVRVENNFYSVPDHLVGHEVTIKNYLREIEVYADSGKVCTHKKIDGFSQTQVDIFHYLGTLEKKPGALKNSKALKSRAELKTIYDEHFTKRTKEFIGILKENQEKGYEALLTLLVAAAKDQTLYRSSTDSTIEDHIHKKTKDGLSQLSQLFMKGGQEYVN
ncbi:MAG: transposase [Clostridia bacterium]|nr:transposase [Clostridia bacterium]